MRVGVTRDEAEVEVICYVESQLRRAGKVIVVVVNAAYPGRKQVRGRYGRFAGVQVLQVGGVMEPDVEPLTPAV